MAWDYKSMTRLACFVAQAGMDRWDRSTVEVMVDTCGWETAFHFYAQYERLYDIDCSLQRGWIVEIKDKEEE